jgi:hypothetical protein
MRKYAWSRHSDDDIWRGGPCDTIKECVEEALTEDYSIDDTFAIGYIEEYDIGLYYADRIIEDLQQDAYDEVGEVAEDWLDYVTKEEMDSLNEQISKVVLDWLEAVKEKPSFYKVRPFEECTLKEALEIYKNHVDNAPKGGKA